MATRRFADPQDLVDAIGPVTFMAIFDDADIVTGLPTGILVTVKAGAVVSNIMLRSHAQVISYLPRAYPLPFLETPAPSIAAGNDSIPVLLKDAELQFAILYAYRRHPEYCKTYGAQPDGPLETSARNMMERIATAVQVVGPTDNAPAVQGAIRTGIRRDGSHRMIIDNADGTTNSGDL